MNYKDLMEITKSVPAWRGTNEYPYAKRTMRDRFFIPVKQDNGETWFHIHDSVELGIMRPDNTFEFTNNVWISNLNSLNWYFLGRGKWITQSKAHGGVILKWVGSKNITPVFKSLRINLETGELHESSKYVVHCKTPDRKQMNEKMKPYEEKLTLAKTFLKAMPIDVFLSDYMNFVDERYTSLRDYSITEYEFKGLLQQDPVGAIYSYMHAINIGNVKNWHQRQKELKKGTGTQYWYGDDPSEKTPVYFYNKVRENFRDKILTQEDAFVYKTYPWENKRFPTSDWNTIVEVNGKPMDRI